MTEQTLTLITHSMSQDVKIVEEYIIVSFNREADQRLSFSYTDSTIPLLPKSEILSLKPSSVAVQPGLCRTRSETRTLVFS